MEGSLPLLLLFLLLTIGRSRAGFYEGDILVSDGDTVRGQGDVAGGVVLADPSKIWPNGLVYYRFDKSFQTKNYKIVENMMRHIESKFDGCLEFQNLDNLDEHKFDYVSITADGGGIGSGTLCFSQLGRVGGKQILNLDVSCLDNVTVVHELVHTLGFVHEFPRNQEPLTVIDIVEIALAYSCPLKQKMMIQYVHYNRLSSQQVNSVLKKQVDQLESKVEQDKQKIDQLESKFEEMEKKFSQLSGLDKEITDLKNGMSKKADSTALTVLNQDISDLKNGMSDLRDQPVAEVCAYQYSTRGTRAVLTYNSLTHTKDTTQLPGDLLDISTGYYTAKLEGTYLVTYSGMASNDKGEEYISIYIRHNGVDMSATQHVSRYTGPSGGSYEQGGRTIMVHLNKGETLAIYCSDCSAGFYRVSFCVKLL